MKRIVGFLFLALTIGNSNAQNRTINIYHLNEDGNTVAQIAFEAAVEYMRSNNYNINFKSSIGKPTTYEAFFESICAQYAEMLDNSSPPHFVLDNTVGGIISACAKAFTGYLSLPAVSSSYGQEGDLRQWENLTSDEERNLIQILPPTDMIPFVIRSLIMYQNYSTAAILADEYYVMDFKYKCLLENLPTRHYIADLDTSNPISQLIHIKKVNIFNIFVLGNAENVRLVLEGADAINMYTKEFSWHAITHENQFIKLNCRNARIIFVKPILGSSYAENMKRIKNTYSFYEHSDLMFGFHYDLAVRSMKAISSMIQGYNRTYNYIKCPEYNGTNSPDRTGMDFMTHFMNATIEPSFGPINVSKNGYSSLDFYMDLEALTFREGTVSYRSNVGNWRAGYENMINFTSPHVLNNYTSYTYYRIVVIQQRPFLFEDPTASKGFSGYCIDLIEIIADILNFDYEINEVVDQRAGYRGGEGEWNGVIRELVERRADIGLGAISITEDRSTAVDFTVPIYEMVGHSILMKVLQEKTSFFRFMHIFDLWVWVWIIVFYFLSSLMLWVLYILSPYGGKYREPDDYRRNFTFIECLWFCLISFTPQGAGEPPSNWSGRIIAGAWWFFAFMIFSSYSANLSAFLTVSRFEAPIKSLDDLANQYKIQYAPVNDSETMRYFKMMADIEQRLYEKWLQMNTMNNSSDYNSSQLATWDYPLCDRYTKLWNTMQRTGLPQTIEEALQRVSKSQSASEGFVLLGDATDIRYFALTNCNYQMVGEEFHKKSYAIATQKGSPLGSQLSNTILQLYNQRHMEILKEKWWARNPSRVQCDTYVSESIGFMNIGGVFIFLGTAVLVLVVIYIIRYVWMKIVFRLRKRKVGAE